MSDPLAMAPPTPVLQHTGHAGWAQRPDAASDLRTVAAHLTSSVAGSDRLLRSVAEGSEDYVLTSADGRVSVRVRLSVDDLPCIQQDVGMVSSEPILVDWSHATVSRGRNRVSLSRTELRLFSALLEGAGASVTRATLIAKAWPHDMLPASERENALAVYVCMLRKRLAAIGAGEELETVRGVGYRMRM